MAADLAEKTDRYGAMLERALAATTIATPEDTPAHEAASECAEMARSYLEDGRHFREENDPVNALAAFSYGYGWLDCGVRMGLFVVESDEELFTA